MELRTNKKKVFSTENHYLSSGDVGQDRTADPQFRKLVLYPTELRRHLFLDSSNIVFSGI
jgi:hypothetical protein